MKYSLTLMLSVCFAFNCFSQVKKPGTGSSAIISYKTFRLKHDNDAVDSLHIPVVSSKYPKIQKALSDTALLNSQCAKAVVDTFASTGWGITHLDFKVSFENEDIISVILNYEYMGAYPSTYTKWLNLDKHTGKPYPLLSEITLKGVNEILKSYKLNLKKDIRQERKDQIDENQGIYKGLIEDADNLRPVDFLENYIFTKKGINFRSEDVLGHAYRNMEPPREWFLSYKQLKIYRAPNSLIVKN